MGTGVPPASAPRSAGPAHPAHPDRLRDGARPEAGDDRGGRRVREHRHRRLDQVDRLAAERAEQQLPDQAAVVHVQPLGGGDEHAQVARDRMPRGGQEEMGVQPGQPAGGHPLLPGGAAQPLLPRGGDLVMPHVGRVAQEQRGAAGRGKCRVAVVAEQHRGPAGEAGRGQAGPAHDRGQRVYLDADQGRLRPAAASGQEHPGRPGAGIHDPGRADPGARRPGDHALDDHRRGERLPEDPPSRRAAQRAERVPERVLPGPDPVPGRGRSRAPGAAAGCAGHQITFRRRPARHAGRAQPAGQLHQRLLARHVPVRNLTGRHLAGRHLAGADGTWRTGRRANAGHPHHCGAARPRGRAFRPAGRRRSCPSRLCARSGRGLRSDDGYPRGCQ